MATISSAGLGSGLDVNGLVSSLMAVERQPATQMQKAATTLQTKLSNYGKMQSYTSAFKDAAAKLALSSTWNSVTTASSDATAVSVSGSASSSSSGTYSVSVSQMASSQSVASQGFTDTTANVGSGTLTIELGKWNADQSGFTPKSGATAVAVSVAATDTLAQVRDKINNANAGVQATIVTDTSGSRLMMRSSTTGEENGFRVTAQDDDSNNADASGLSSLAYDPSQSVNNMTKTQTAANALAKVNGLSISSASNTLTSVVDGVSLTLNKVTPETAPIAITVSSDTTAIKTAITNFSKAYNDLSSYLTSQTSYDATAKKGATFQGDSAVIAMRASLRNLASGSGGSATKLSRLADIGLDIKTDGTISVSATKLDAALTNTDNLRKMFVTSGTVTGLGQTFSSWGSSMLSADGALSTRQSSLQRQVTANTKQQDDFEVRMTSVETRIRAQYTALDSTMSKMSGLSSYVTQQITQMNR